MMYKNILQYTFIPDIVLNSSKSIYLYLEIQRVKNKIFKDINILFWTFTHQSLKNLKIQPLSLNIKMDSKTKFRIFKVKKANKNPISLNIFKTFGIKKYNKKEISKIVEKYQNNLKIKNQDKIIKNYEDLFAAIKGSFFNFTKSLENHE